MDLKEMVLSALTDLQTQEVKKASEHAVATAESVALGLKSLAERKEPEKAKEAIAPEMPSVQTEHKSESGGEAKFLIAVKERLLVLFEGFQSPNNKAVEAKVDLTLNFLEYLLSAIEERLSELERK
ncbi:MAG: hypothetical protein LBI57_06335 [Helicobacteraceae bacterium]|jgi:hypothetical protein|nr:hypothetical protein [Helicobacteraceae bacterium]